MHVEVPPVRLWLFFANAADRPSGRDGIYIWYAACRNMHILCISLSNGPSSAVTCLRPCPHPRDVTSSTEAAHQKPLWRQLPLPPLLHPCDMGRPGDVFMCAFIPSPHITLVLILHSQSSGTLVSAISQRYLPTMVREQSETAFSPVHPVESAVLFW
jgi:hypothetical protein